MQEHIEWIKAAIEIAQENTPILVNCLKLCLTDAEQKLHIEKKQILDALEVNKIELLSFNVTGEDYYNIKFKSK